MTLTIALQEMQAKQQHYAQNVKQDMDLKMGIAQHVQEINTVMVLQHVLFYIQIVLMQTTQQEHALDVNLDKELLMMVQMGARHAQKTHGAMELHNACQVLTPTVQKQII